MANVKITDLSAAAALTGAELAECVQAGDSLKMTVDQIVTYTTSQLGTMATQDADAVSITGGSVDFDVITGHPYGKFYSTVDQTASINTPTAATFNTTVLSQGISVVSNSRITFTDAGVYELIYKMQFASADTAAQIVNTWVRINGSDVTGSNTKVTVPKVSEGGNAYREVSALITVTAGQYAEIIWMTPDVDVSLDSTAAVVGPPAYPLTPSITVIAQKF